MQKKQLQALTLEQKCALLSGATTFGTRALPKNNIPSITLSDGPNGVRKQAGAADHLEAGPALRQTRFVDYTENSVAGRGASRFAWKLSGATEFTSDTAIFFDSSATINNTAALTARMFGALATRLSYNLAWEQDPPVGLQSLDTTTRVTLVYDF